MENNYSKEAADKFPDAVSNYEALTLLSNEVHKKLMALKDQRSDEFILLRNKYFAIRLLKKNSPVILTKTA